MKRKTLIFSIALGIIGDILFWNKGQGISFFIFIFFILFFLSLTLKETHLSPHKKGYIFLIPIFFFALMGFVLSEPVVSFLNRVVTFLLIGVWMASFEKGNWLRFGLADYALSGIRFGFNLISFPWLRSANLGLFPDHKKETSDGIKTLLRGFAIALPILLLLSALFASADMIFADQVENLWKFIDIENFSEYILRAFLIFLFANFFLGLLVFSAKNREKESYYGENNPLLKPFLGPIESGIVLSSVVLLYLTFIVLQFRYFFFNQSAIIELGYTYAEYARRGFGELIATSVISLTLILTLKTITIETRNKKSHLSSWLIIGLILCNLIVLVSAFIRLNLYESAYGFTRLRIYSHIFIIWLGILLVASGVLVWKNKIRLIANISLVFIIGFTATLNLINPDQLIVMRNVQRTLIGKPLDSSYLGSLSSDAMPALVKSYNSMPSSKSTNISLGAALVCNQFNNQAQLADTRWQSFNLSHDRARKLVSGISHLLSEYQITEEDWNILIEDAEGNETFCNRDLFFD